MTKSHEAEIMEKGEMSVRRGESKGGSPGQRMEVKTPWWRVFFVKN